VGEKPGEILRIGSSRKALFGPGLELKISPLTQFLLNIISFHNVLGNFMGGSKE